MDYTYAGTTLTCTTDIPEDEAKAYIEYLRDKHGPIESVEVTIDGDYADLSYQKRTEPFERIRRITGYLSSSFTIAPDRMVLRSLVSRPGASA